MRLALPLRLRILLSCVIFLVAAHASPAAPLRNRVTQPVAPGDTVVVENSVPPRVQRSVDLGPIAPDTRLDSMTLSFSMSPEQQAELEQLLADLQNPASPRYHRWLTPAEYAAQFGLSSADLASVRNWLSSQGFTVTEVARGGQFIRFTGTAAQAQSAFRTSIHNVAYGGETHFANVSNPVIPHALAGLITGVSGLHNFGLRPRVQAHPQFTSSISGNHFLAPGDIYTIYGMQGLMNSGYDGTGLTIAVVGQVDINPADLTAFRAAAGLSNAVAPVTVHEGGDPGAAHNCSSSATNCPTPNQDDLAESSIDVEWSSAMAPGAAILFVNGPDVLRDAMTQAIDQNLAPIITTSYGACESAWGTTELNALNALFRQAAAQGQSVIGPSADVGATDCDAAPSASKGLAVDFPGSSPYVTSLGGTQFNDGSAVGGTTFWSNTEGATTHGGSALGYIPEAVWNDAGGFGASGGGASAFFSKPTWQQGTGVPADGQRDVPDISLAASDSHDEFLYCVNVATGGSCVNGFRAADTTLKAAGGTSLDSQIFGGMLALIEQKVRAVTGIATARLGNINPMLYSIANNPTYYVAGETIATNGTVAFNDVTSGDNKMPCTAGTTNCPNAGTKIGYAATPGFDLATGWGSVNLTNLANAWISASGGSGTHTASLNLAAAPSTVAAGALVTLTATVTGASGTPSGTVQFLVNGTIVATGTLVNGTATATYTTSCANLAALTAPRLIPPPVRPAVPAPGNGYPFGSSVLAAGLLLLGFRRRTRLPGLYVALIAAALTAGLAGCGGSSVAASAGASSGSSSNATGHLTVSAWYSGDNTYVSTASAATSSVIVTVTRGGC